MRLVELPESWREQAAVITEVVDPESWFSQDELAPAQQFRLDKRRQEWMLARIAAKHLAIRSESMSPLAVNVLRSGQLSLSHSDGYGAAARCTSDRRIGIDIESHRELKESAAHLFLTDDEADMMRCCSLPYRALHFWCAKEALWKAHEGEVLTLKQVRLRLIEERERGLVFDRAETFDGEVLGGLATIPATG